MQARGVLMIEHRLIEEILRTIQHILEHLEITHTIDPDVVDKTVDFIRMYADRTHHGKEEDILFRELKKKTLTSRDSQTMDRLIDDHVLSRSITKSLIEANIRYRKGDKEAVAEVMTHLKMLVEFYPKHIELEDDVFFPASRTYFSDTEDQAMLNEFWEHDRKMIHEKYKSVIKEVEGII